MPTYGYECKSCGHTFDAFQAMSDAPLKDCPQCGKEIRRLIFGGTGVIFKGSGFYVTDKGKGKAASSASAKTPKPAETSANAAAESAPKKSDAASASSGGGISESKDKAAVSKSA